MHPGQQAAGCFQPFLGETPGQAPDGLRYRWLLRRSTRHAQNFSASRDSRFNGIARTALRELLVIESRLLQFACGLFFHEDPAMSQQQSRDSTTIEANRLGVELEPGLQPTTN
jgi:hypothetical protein